MASKRKHKTLTLKDKMNILKKLDSGENMCKLANEYGVGRSTLHDLKKRKQKIVEHVQMMESGPGMRKTLRVGNCPKMENALYMWFIQESSKNNSISGEILKAKAIEFYQKITNKNDFRASIGWLDKFKKRFGIRFLTANRDESAVQIFIQRFKDKVEEMGLLPDQVYNADDSCLLWRMLPHKTFEASKDRLTFMPCSNATGTHKLDLLVIGKVKNPFKNICLPVCYRTQWESWDTREVFSQWFHKQFVPEVKKFMARSNLPQKALLVLGNVQGHSNQEFTSSDGMIQTIFLPPNCSSLLQPMNQNVIQKVKKLYKNKLLLHIVSQNRDIKQCLKELNIKEVVFFLAHSWNSIPPNLIQSSWKNLWPSIHASQETKEWETEELPTAVWLQSFADRGLEISETDLNSWFEGSEDIKQMMTDEEICEEICEEVQEDEMLDPPTTSTKVQPDVAFNCFNTCITWAEENGLSAEDVLFLRKLQEKVFKQELQKD